MSENPTQLPKPKKNLSIWNRILFYFLFALSITAVLFFVTPGYYIDEVIANIILIIYVAVIELRKDKGNQKG